MKRLEDFTKEELVEAWRRLLSDFSSPHLDNVALFNVFERWLPNRDAHYAELKRLTEIVDFFIGTRDVGGCHDMHPLWLDLERKERAAEATNTAVKHGVLSLPAEALAAMNAQVEEARAKIEERRKAIEAEGWTAERAQKEISERTNKHYAVLEEFFGVPKEMYEEAYDEWKRRSGREP